MIYKNIIFDIAEDTEIPAFYVSFWKKKNKACHTYNF